jgi:uncharacterized protein (DUF2344 family)
LGTVEETLDQTPDEGVPEEDSPQQGQPQKYRYRITYSKHGSLRYTSQLDLARIWERTLRRAGMSLVYSQGFNPRPKIPVERLNAASPRGLVSLEVRQVETSEASLQSIVWSTVYEVRFRQPQDWQILAERVEELLARTELWRDRRDKRVDVRPLIDHLSVSREPETMLVMELAASADRGTARPDEILAELGLEPADALVLRTAIHFRPDALTG